jgi:predicted nuclease of predicted toxin-antitoxin system
MKFLVDAQLPPGLCEWLRARAHEAEHVGPGATADTAIADRAERDGAVLVSKDEDFRLLRLPDRFALLWLRCGNVTNPALVEWLDGRWDQVERDRWRFLGRARGCSDCRRSGRPGRAVSGRSRN